MSDSHNLQNETSVDSIIKEILGGSNVSAGMTPHQRVLLMHSGLPGLSGGEIVDGDSSGEMLEGGKKSKTAWIKLVMKNYKKIKRSQGSKNAFKKALKLSKRQYKKKSRR